MEIKVKNYVVEELKTFSYILKNVTKEDLINLFTLLLQSEVLFDSDKDNWSILPRILCLQ